MPSLCLLSVRRGLGWESDPGRRPGTRPAQVPATAFGTILVTLENPSGAREDGQLLLNGEAFATLTVPAGETGRATLRARVDSPARATVALEAVTGGGRRARQDVSVEAGATTPVSLRIG